MNDQLMTAGLILLNQLLQRAAQVSTRIQTGTLDKAFLDAQQIEDAASRERQLEALNRARGEGR